MATTNWNHKFIATAEVRIHYVRQGAGFPLILLHGWPEFWYTWHKNIPVLAENFDVIAPDLRGFGQSGKPEGAAAEVYSLDRYVADLEALADELGLARFGIVAHDIGAMVAQAYVRQNPERVAGLFFFNVPYPGIGSRWANPENMKEVWYQGFNQQPWAADLVASSRKAAKIYFGNLLAHWAHDPHAFDEDIDVWVDNFLEPGNIQGGFNWYKAIFPLRLKIIRGELSPLLPIATPTRVRWGESEPFMLVSFADRLGEFFTNLDFKSVPKAGHFVHYEKSAYANREIYDFFARRRDEARAGPDRV